MSNQNFPAKVCNLFKTIFLAFLARKPQRASPSCMTLGTRPSSSYEGPPWKCLRSSTSVTDTVSLTCVHVCMYVCICHVIPKAFIILTSCHPVHLSCVSVWLPGQQRAGPRWHLVSNILISCVFALASFLSSAHFKAVMYVRINAKNTAHVPLRSKI